MKKFLILSSLFSLITVTGCSQIKNENAIYCYKSLDKESLEISERKVDYMLDNHLSFALLTYASTCGLCEKAKENLKEFSKNNDYLVYSMEVYPSSIEYLVNEHPDIFSSTLSYPDLMIFNKGKLTYNISSGDLENYTTFSRKLTPQLIESNIYTGKNSGIFDKEDNYLLFIYNSLDSNHENTYLQKLINLAEKSDKTTLIIDISSAKTELINKISELFGEDILVVSIFENKQIKTTIRYLSASGNEVDNLFNTFFNVNTINRSL